MTFHEMASFCGAMHLLSVKYFVAVLCIMLFCLPAGSASDFFCPFKFASKTAAEAKKKGIFVSNLSAIPPVFDWNDHKFKIHEAWLEQLPNRNDRRFYCFTLEADSHFPAELGGYSLFRGNDGIYWHRRFPVHCFQMPEEQKQLDLYVTDTRAPNYHIGSPLPGEPHILLIPTRTEKGNSVDSQLGSFKNKLKELSSSFPSKGPILENEWNKVNEQINNILASITEPSILADMALWPITRISSGPA